MPIITQPEGLGPDQLKPSRRSLGLLAATGVAFAAYAPAALGQEAQPIHTPSDGLVTTEVSYPSEDGFVLPAYVARPQGDGPYPVVIVVSEIFGIHEYIRDTCRRLAHAGYVAIAPAFFVRAGDPAPLADMQAVMAIVAQAQYEQVMGDIQASLDWLATQPYADSSKVGITGFCWGGKVVWQAVARFAPIKAGVAWYGRLSPAASATGEQKIAGQPWPIDLVGELKAPVIGLYGDQDSGIPTDTVAAMNAALGEAGQTHSHITLFEGAPHGFHADYRPMYRKAAAEAGQQMMFEHFKRWL
ncbi:dienelactone hydrolase family protein [Brevundimonas terrae]|uniref:Dienelactone hydrolase family protein n=1 Tax=Brevundimonas terrae TaxID=363631 RepID=A0ABP3HVT6_9CAUL|nr:dienelactone hydrolase family protein [Brevundimonas terrae]NIJ25830.1 carboxymethylenebutenolidase [Brevundimonas terrae]